MMSRSVLTLHRIAKKTLLLSKTPNKEQLTPIDVWKKTKFMLDAIHTFTKFYTHRLHFDEVMAINNSN